MNDEQGEHTTKKKNNVLPIYGNDCMNLNPLILTNIQSSNYFKVTLFQLKTYHEVIDEIYYQVKHLEPWERGSRKTSGNSGMCGSVRGVGSGGIVSSAFCLLYKLYTLKLTRKQLNGLIKHTDSPYIRALGFMYIRFSQPPSDLYDWYEEFLQDEEEIDVKAGGGNIMTIGQMCRQFLVKLDWFSTLFPRIPVPIQKSIEQKLNEYDRKYGTQTVKNSQRHSGATSSDERVRDRPYKEYRDERKRSKSPAYKEYRDERKRSPNREKHSKKSYRDRSRERDYERRERKREYEYEEGKCSRRN
jgi:pre-mRNA-splicing factor 38B